MAALQERLSWHAAEGAVHDGDRRYLLMRPDVLMGAVARLDDAARRQWLAAVAESTQEHGAKSLQAYAQRLDGDAQALIRSTVEAAADLGWGRWVVGREADALTLEVSSSPFVAGWRGAAGQTGAQAVCAPIRGLFTALAGLVTGELAEVEEVSCAAASASAQTCRFIARRRA